jgi:hypothetical protein
MNTFLFYVLCLVAFCVTGVVGCLCRVKKNPWLAAVCALGCVAWTVLMIYSLFTWLNP